MSRRFEAKEAIRESVPLLIGLVGASSSGKTNSALRLATGIQKVSPGPIVGIDTEAKRMLHYSDNYSFKHIEFKEPFGSLDYIDVLEYAETLKPSVIIVDSTSHEREGVGGMLDLHEQEVQRMAGNDYAKQERVKLICWSKPKQYHRRLVNKILQMNCNFIFCFRAKEISKPMKNKKTGKTEVQEMGFIPVASPDMIYEMTLNCYLPPNSNGIPVWKSDRLGESQTMKLPQQFKHIFEGKEVQLSEDIGEQLALWSKGSDKKQPSPKPEQKQQTQKSNLQFEDVPETESSNQNISVAGLILNLESIMPTLSENIRDGEKYSDSDICKLYIAWLKKSPDISVKANQEKFNRALDFYVSNEIPFE